MVRLAICDDNDLQLDMVRDMINEYIADRHLDVQVLAFNSGKSLIEVVRESGAFDIYFLDMLMPDMNGLEVASTLRMMGDKGKIIFLTASLDYAVASYDVQAFYYMVKPVDRMKMFKVMDNAFADIRSGAQNILIKTRQGDLFLNTDDIMYVDLADRCPNYHTKDGRTAVGQAIRTSFKDTLTMLMELDNFAVCGVTTLVNLNYVDVMGSDGVLLRDGTQLFPSRACYHELYRSWKDYKS